MLEVPELASGNPQLQKAMKKIVEAEARPIQKIEERQSKIDNRLKLVKDFKTKSTEARDSATPFKTPQDFRELKGTSSFPDILNVTSVDKSIAKVGSYDIEVMQLANTNSISTYGFPDRDQSEVGVGYMTFQTPDGEEKEVYIGSDNNTLDGVASAINSANVGAKALVVHDGSDADEPWRLIITSEKTGWKNSQDWFDFNMLNGDLDFDMDRSREAQSAIVKLNGEPLMVDENSVKNLIPGVNFDLKQIKPGQLVKLDIRPDFEKISDKAKNMVDKINAVLSFIQTQNNMDKKSRDDATKALGGDTMLRIVESRTRSVIQQTMNQLEDTEIQRLRDLGIVFNRNGTLDFDAAKFQNKLETHFDDVSTFFTGDGVVGGFAKQIVGLFDGVVRRGDGMAFVAEKSLQGNIDGLETKKRRATEIAEQKIERTKLQFARVEGAIQKMQQMGSSIGNGGGIGGLISSAGVG